MEKFNCLNNYTENNIDSYFGESEESMKKCSKCNHFCYDNGMIQCDLINKQYENKKK